MSQRLFSTLLVMVMFVGFGLLAAAQHTLPPFGSIADNVLTFVTPAIGVFYVLSKWLDTVDAKVADGSLTPGLITPLFSLPEFYTAIVACLAGVVQTFGFKLLDADTQTFIVNSLLVVVSVLLRSFTERTPAATAKSIPPKAA